MTEMQSKIKELTDKIYQEGFEKASKEAEEIIQEAKNEAEKVTTEANERAETIISDARKQAEEDARKLEAEVRLASRQALMALKKEITDLIKASILKEPLNKAFADQDFIRKILETLIKSWQPCSEQTGLHVFVPGEQIKEMEAYLEEKAGSMMNNGLVLEKYSGTGNGFEIQPGKENYKINVTDEAFEVFLEQHFKKHILDFLYGETAK